MKRIIDGGITLAGVVSLLTPWLPARVPVTMQIVTLILLGVVLGPALGIAAHLWRDQRKEPYPL